MSKPLYHVPILGYHRVGQFRADHVPTVSPETFERQLAFLARHRYRVVNLDEAAAGLEGDRALRHAVVLTFDDGYEETSTIAWPLLKRFGFPATVFITPQEVGLPGFSTWEQVVEMSRDGMVIGSHTLHHAYLPEVSPERLPEEIAGSKEIIEQRIGQPVRYFSYPIGGFTPQILEIVRQAGYVAACTTNRFALDGGRFALRRLKVTERDGHPVMFWAKVSGYYDAFRQLKQPH